MFLFLFFSESEIKKLIFFDVNFPIAEAYFTMRKIADDA